jgi:uncharacterized protein YchJ
MEEHIECPNFVEKVKLYCDCNRLGQKQNSNREVICGSGCKFTKCEGQI